MQRSALRSRRRRPAGQPQDGLRARLELSSASATPGLTALLLLGVLALELFMIGSYVGALHRPEPREVPVAVVGPPRLAGPLAARLGGGGELDARVVADVGAARRAIADREVYGALVPGPAGDRLLVAGAASAAVAEALPRAIRAAEPPGRTLAVSDVKPLPSSDPRGLSPFYLVVGWLVGGYLGATVLGLARGGVARCRRAALGRLGALAAYALASGLLGTLLAQQAVGVLSGASTLALAAAGTLLVFATGAATAALQALLGVAGTALAILLFVALGNPASGGPLASELLMPGPWRAVGWLLPPGAGATLVTNLAYFDSGALGRPLAVLAGYALGGALVTLVTVRRHARAGEEAEAVAEAAAAA